MPALFSYVLLSLLPIPGYADRFSAEVKQAEITLQGDSYVLSADIVYQLSEKAMDALQNGVPLFWDIQVKILQHQDIIWDKRLLETSVRYRIQYHALLNMYRVSNERNGDVHNFSTLSAALDSMSAIRDFDLIDKAKLASERQYQFAIKVNFDREALPLPLRPIAYTDPQWYLSSEWTLWPLRK